MDPAVASTLLGVALAATAGFVMLILRWMREDIRRLDVRVDRLETKVDRIETKVHRLDTKVDRLDTKVDRLEEKLDGLILGLLQAGVLKGPPGAAQPFIVVASPPVPSPETAGTAEPKPVKASDAATPRQADPVEDDPPGAAAGTR